MKRRVLIAMLQESGHLNPTFWLARKLKGRGWDVRYLASSEAAESLIRQGFEVISNTTALAAAVPPVAGPGVFGLMASRRAITRNYQRTLKALRTASNATDLLGFQPDIMLIDVTQSQLAIWARRVGLPFVYLNSSLPQTEDRGLAPLRSPTPYAGDVLGQLKIHLLWRAFGAKRHITAQLAAGLGMRPPYDLARREARARFGTPGAMASRTVYMPQFLDVPELVLCPRSFDFPRAARPSRHYVGCVDLARDEHAATWTPMEAARPLVYCALGGQVYRPRDTPRFFQRVLEVFRSRPDWQLCLSVGRHVSVAELGPLPPNVTVMTRAPQLAVLKRASLMLTHGGLNSVKECIASGVPMIVFPLAVDQPGNAARVEYHGLGMRGDIAKSSPSEIEGMIDRCLSEPSFAAACRTMAAEWEAGRGPAEALAVRVIEGALPAGR